MSECPRAKSDMTPCVVKDGDMALAEDQRCVGCGMYFAPATPAAREDEDDFTHYFNATGRLSREVAALKQEITELERDAKLFRAIRACFPVAEDRWTHDRFVLTTQEDGGAFCTYQAATLQEFDDAMQEFEERAEDRAATPERDTR